MIILHLLQMFTSIALGIAITLIPKLFSTRGLKTTLCVGHIHGMTYRSKLEVKHIMVHSNAC